MRYNTTEIIHTIVDGIKSLEKEFYAKKQIEIVEDNKIIEKLNEIYLSIYTPPEFQTMIEYYMNGIGLYKPINLVGKTIKNIHFPNSLTKVIKYLEDYGFINVTAGWYKI